MANALKNIEAMARKNAKASEKRNEVKGNPSLVKWNKEVKADAFREKCRVAVEEMQYHKEQCEYADSEAKKGN